MRVCVRIEPAGGPDYLCVTERLGREDEVSLNAEALLYELGWPGDFVGRMRVVPGRGPPGARVVRGVWEVKSVWVVEPAWEDLVSASAA